MKNIKVLLKVKLLQFLYSIVFFLENVFRFISTFLLECLIFHVVFFLYSHTPTLKSMAKCFIQNY